MFHILKFTGASTETFLQGQLTADIKNIKENESRLTAYCDYKGRMLASGWIFCDAQHFYFLLSSDIAENTKTHLTRFAVFSKIKISDATAEWHIALCAEMPKTTPSDAIWIPLFQGSKRGFFISRSAYVGNTLSFEIWNALNIQDQFVMITQPLQNKFIPQMLYYEKLGAVSFTKGCYVGQEIVARTEHLGKMKRHLYPATTTDNAVKIADAVLDAHQNPLGLIIACSPSKTAAVALLIVLPDAEVEAKKACFTQNQKPIAILSPNP